MPKIYNAMQLTKGARAEHNRLGTITQPIQFLLKEDKDDDWAAWNMDWLEMQGLKQIRRNARKLLKNYKLANGIIDKSDYIVEEDTETAELIDILTKEDASAFELKFFPIIPNVINVLTGEFTKRQDKISYRAIDDISFNETMEAKRVQIEEALVTYAEQKMQQTLQSMGLTPDSEQGQQMMSPESLKSLPEIERFFRKDYKSVVEEWAYHQHNVDEERFHMRELETIAFKDMLISDSEFWHFKMNEDDYEIELWNPVLCFYHKSPEAPYISQSNWAGRIDLMTISDVIDKYGYMMTQEQLESLEHIYPTKSAGYNIPGYQNDGTFYDATKSHDWNTYGPSLGMRQFISAQDDFISNGDDVILRILNESEDIKDFSNFGLIRVTTAYWKSQRMIGHLTSIDENGFIKEMIVDENYVVTTRPVYDTSVIKNKNKDTLIYGEHIDWIWINEVWGGIKIGPNRPAHYGNHNTNSFNPIYLDVKPCKFQFKGDFTIYGCKLPVEGCVFSHRNTKRMSLVDKMKPYQIGYNLVNNQIADILIDELGTIILLDQNSLPQHSAGEDWGKNNFAKAYVAMRDFSMLPLDTSISNTESAMNFNHFQVLNLEQIQRLMSRIQLATYFKSQCFETIGISPERLGSINARQTATGVEQAINNSYSQTEQYFTQHSEYLMPRIHQMRTDLAQYYHSNNPSVRLQYMTTMDEKINFAINGTSLLARELNVFVSTRVNVKHIMEQIRQLALNNNTAGASIHDLAGIVKAQGMAELNNVMLSIEQKLQKQREDDMQHQQEIAKLTQDAENQRLEAELRHEAEQRALDREKDIQVAEIRAAGYTGMNDRDMNEQNDFIDTLEFLDKRNANKQKLQLEKEKNLTQQNNEQVKNDLKRQELRTREKIADKQLQIARENKYKHEMNKPKK